MKISLCIAAFVALAGCASASFPPSAPSRVDLYRRGDGGESIVCMRAPDRDVCASSDQLGNQFSDCSDADFECVFDYYNVFAVPKKGVALGQEFEVFGAALKVERCFGEANQCEMAMISSHCAAGAECACRVTDVGETRGVFYYSKEEGITAFYTTLPKDQHVGSGAETAASDDAIPLRIYVLAAESGFLRERWNIRAAKTRARCVR